MKIDVIGSHCTWTKKLSTSFIINDNLLLDAPEGSFKTLLNDYDLNKIEYIIFTHFHSDHFAGVYLVLDVLSRTNKEITILAPNGAKERILRLLRSLDVLRFIGYVENKIKFIDCENGKVVKIGNYKIKCFRMVHEAVASFGFVIDDGTKVGFTGDTSMCNNVHKIIKSCKSVFIDTASVDVNLKHLSLNEVCALRDKYQDVSLYPVHLVSNEKDIVANSFVLLEQGQVVNI